MLFNVKIPEEKNHISSIKINEYFDKYMVYDSNKVKKVMSYKKQKQI